jgi:hypothetical protein
MDLKIVFIFILGIVTSALIYKIVHHKVYDIDGFLGIEKAFKKAGKKLKDVGKKIAKVAKDPFAGIKKTINTIINGVNMILCFIKYLTDLFVWCAHTMACIFALFVPPCPFFYIIDMFIAFIGFILGSLLRLVGLEMLIEAFSLGCDGINFLTNAVIGVEILDFHSWLGIKPLCYNPKFAFTPFPKYTPPKKKK